MTDTTGKGARNFTVRRINHTHMHKLISFVPSRSLKGNMAGCVFTGWQDLDCIYSGHKE
jgi:hypothetical protein